jgi:hypothetical protein
MIPPFFLLLATGWFTGHIIILFLERFYFTYHSRFIPEGLAEASQIFLRDNNNNILFIARKKITKEYCFT